MGTNSLILTIGHNPKQVGLIKSGARIELKYWLQAFRKLCAMLGAKFGAQIDANVGSNLGAKLVAELDVELELELAAVEQVHPISPDVVAAVGHKVPPPLMLLLSA